jgi:5-methylcytosine-specific restriction endonuclease McrA
MAGEPTRTEDWKTLPWKKFQRNVFRIQKRIYQAQIRGNFKRVRGLQRLLLRSYSARCLAVRQVSQDNKGKKTPGVDGLARLTPLQRMQMVGQVGTFSLSPAPIRRVYIPKASNPNERRPLGIPIMRDRAEQALVKLVLEPEWEARFEPNSYGFRPGRSPHDAIEAIVSNIIRFADDFVIICEDLATIQAAQTLAESWLASIGLALKASKTYITHTLYKHEGHIGFDFLGFTVRQFPMSIHHSKKGYKVIVKPSKRAQTRHLEQVETLIQTHRGSNQTALIAALNPRIRGWTNYHRTCSAKRTFNRMDHQLYWKLTKWAKWQNPRKNDAWRKQRYWPRKRNRFDFSDGKATLAKYADTPIKRHVKVQGSKTPFDGDWAYWIDRLGRDPSKPKRVVTLLRRQEGRCMLCGLRFMSEDHLEVHHRDGNHNDNMPANLALLHGHCHDEVHRTKYS